MVKHIILWKLKDEFKSEEVKLGIKNGLESLKGKIPGLVTVKVYIKGLPSSNADVMLWSEFESEKALKEYAIHPEHVRIADTYVRPYTQSRNCMDFEE